MQTPINPSRYITIPVLQRAIVQDANGKPKAVSDIPLPPLQPGTILVKTAAVALQPSDNKMGGISPSAGAVIGSDFAGTVVLMHEETQTDLQIGDLVCGVVHGSNPADGTNGAFAEFVRAHADLVLRLPRSGGRMHWPIEPATLGSALATTSLALWGDPGALALTASPDAQAVTPFPVLVYGASTAVGTMATQLLRLSGLEVVATCSPRNFDLVRSYGAGKVFDYAPCPDESHDEAGGGAMVGRQIRADTGGRLRHALDCIVDTESIACCQAALGRVGGRHALLERWPRELDLNCRRTVRAEFVMGLEVFGEEVVLPGEYGRLRSEEKHQEAVRCFGMFERLSNDCKLRSHPVEVVEGGLDGIVDGLCLLKKGSISGKKLVALI